MKKDKSYDYEEVVEIPVLPEGMTEVIFADPCKFSGKDRVPGDKEIVTVFQEKLLKQKGLI